jgi:hypothetical protein
LHTVAAQAASSVAEAAAVAAATAAGAAEGDGGGGRPPASAPPPPPPAEPLMDARLPGWLYAFPPASRRALAAAAPRRGGAAGSASASAGAAALQPLSLSYRAAPALQAHARALHQLQLCLFHLRLEADVASALVPAAAAPEPGDDGDEGGADGAPLRRFLARCRLAHAFLCSGSQGRRPVSIVEAVEEEVLL